MKNRGLPWTAPVVAPKRERVTKNGRTWLIMGRFQCSVPRNLRMIKALLLSTSNSVNKKREADYSRKRLSLLKIKTETVSRRNGQRETPSKKKWKSMTASSQQRNRKGQTNQARERWHWELAFKRRWLTHRHEQFQIGPLNHRQVASNKKKIRK